MADLPTVSGTAIAFSEFDPKNADGPNCELGRLQGGVLHSLPQRSSVMLLMAGHSHFGYVQGGILRITTDGGNVFMVPSQFCFSINGAACVVAEEGDPAGMVVSKPDYKAYTQMTFVEWRGRLRYINGCTDSLLISPVRCGDPCLNLLYFPAGIDQTMHTHPSDRIGMILSGGGQCVSDDERGRIVTPLKAGMLFCIHAGGHHKFRTFHGDMRVLAYHPDSDFGPTDEDHPMINRTMVDGVSAADLPDLHTRE